MRLKYYPHDFGPTSNYSCAIRDCDTGIRAIVGAMPAALESFGKPIKHPVRSAHKVNGRVQAVISHRASAGSGATYGLPGLRTELADQSIVVIEKRVARLMRSAVLHGVKRHRGFIAFVYAAIALNARNREGVGVAMSEPRRWFGQ